MDDCLFCKIINGEIPCYKIYEDEHTLAFLDISNDGIGGHTLVLPKTHTQNITTVSDGDLNYVMATVQKISKHYIDDCGFDGVNILNNCNECAGQTIKHLHFHIVPRANGDKIGAWDLKSLHNLTLEHFREKLKLQN